VTTWDEGMTPRPRPEPRREQVETSWRLRGPSGQVLTCAMLRRVLSSSRAELSALQKGRASGERPQAAAPLQRSLAALRHARRPLRTDNIVIRGASAPVTVIRALTPPFKSSGRRIASYKTVLPHTESSSMMADERRPKGLLTRFLPVQADK
jgi:hypothetical protein